MLLLSAVVGAMMPATKVEGWWFKQGDQSIMVSEHFAAGEFYKHRKGKWFVNAELPPRLEILRALRGCPCELNSSFRTWEQNEDAGGAEDSEHMEGAAADIDTGSYAESLKLAVLAVKAGFRRIGIAKGFLHVGVRETGGKLVVWGYGAYSRARVTRDLMAALVLAGVTVR